MREHVGVVRDRIESRSPSSQGQRVHQPVRLADPTACNDAFETMSDKDTGSRCVTTPLNLGFR